MDVIGEPIRPLKMQAGNQWSKNNAGLKWSQPPFLILEGRKKFVQADSEGAGEKMGRVKV